MGLFGIFATLFGLCSYTKNTVKNSIDYYTAFDEAENNSKAKFISNQSFYSTKTGKKCFDRVNNYNKHVVTVDVSSGIIIDDVTESYNKRKTNDARNNASNNNEKFYRTYEFCCNGNYHLDVFINDDMPGEYFERVKYGRNNEREYCGYRFYKRDVKKECDKYGNIIGYSFCKLDKTLVYAPDGKVLTKAKEYDLMIEDAEKISKIRGDRFFKCYMMNGPMMNCSYAKDINTGEPFYYDHKYRYYIPGIVKSKEIVLKNGESYIAMWTEPDLTRTNEKYRYNGDKY